MDERTKEIMFKAGIVAMNADHVVFEKLQLEHFAELVRQDEREACAKACERVHDDYINDRNNDGYDWPDGHDCADAIRARCEK